MSAAERATFDRVDVILPCLDEAAVLGWVLGRIPAGYRAIVVDNGSTDGSADIAEAMGAWVVRERLRGYGSACHAGLLAATAPLVAVLDCDGSLDPSELPRLVDPVRRGAYDLAVCRRVATQRSAWPLHARVANRALARRVSRRAGLRIRDIGPMRVAGREPLLALGLRDRRSGYPLETVLRAVDAGWRLLEVPVGYAPRVGRSKVTGTWWGTAQAVVDMRRALGAVNGP